MNFYDKVHEMARAFKNTDEYKEYMRLKDEIKKDSNISKLVEEFKTKQNQNQMSYINGEKLEEEKVIELQNLYSIIIQNENARKFLEYEMKLNVMLADTQKILADAVKDIVEF